MLKLKDFNKIRRKINLFFLNFKIFQPKKKLIDD